MIILAFLPTLAVPAPAAQSETRTLHAPGEELWAKGYDGPKSDFDSPSSVASDGTRVYVTGQSVGKHTGWDYGTVAYDATTGARLWAQRYNGSGKGSDTASSITTDSTRVYVTGRSDASGGTGDNGDYATVAYDAATGDELWVGRYDSKGNGSDEPWAVATDGTGVYVTGRSVGVGSGFDYATVAYDAATGIKRWARRYTSPGPRWDLAYSVATDGAGVYVTGSSFSGPVGEDYATVAYDAATGRELWTKRYNGPVNGSGTAYSVATDGIRVYVTGESAGSGTDYDYATLAYDAATGDRLWVSRYDGPASGWDRALSVVTAGHGVYVTGWSPGSGTDFDYATVAYDAGTGITLWAKRYNGRGDGADSANSVSTDGVGVFVTGESFGVGTDSDFATVAYDSITGHELWVNRYSGPGKNLDEAHSVVTDGTGVYVTGQSFGEGTDFDYATVAYQA